MVVRAVVTGMGAGLVGAAVMTLGEKAEQAITHRPDSYIPARTLLALLGRRPPEDAQPIAANLAMHYGTGALLGALRGWWSELGLRGAEWSALHSAVRLSFDQSLENATGVGAPPATWPRQEHVIDVLHKVVYSVVTGAVADALVQPRPRPLPGRTSH